VRKCLAKEPDRRWQTAQDLHDELEWIAEGKAEADISAPAVGAPPRLWKRALTIGLAVLVGAVLTGIVFLSLMAEQPRPVARFTIAAPTTAELATGMAFSPDGNELVYSVICDGVRQLYRRPVDQLGALPIAGTEGANYPFFSPDGQWVGFFSGDNNTISKVVLAGGPPVALCDAGTVRGASWGVDDTITFVAASGVMQVQAGGGEPWPITTVTTDQGELGHGDPEILPGGKAVLFQVWYGTAETSRIAVQSLETGERKMLIDGMNPRYAPTGHIVFARSSSLWAVPFDRERLELDGSAVPVIQDLRVWRNGEPSRFSLSRNGSLAYIPAEESTADESQILWVDRQGEAVPLAETSGPYRYGDPRLSPDGQRLAVGTGTDVWILDLVRDTMTRLTFGEGGNMRPLWSPDGERIFFASGRVDGTYNIFWKPPDGSGDAAQLTRGAYRVPTSVSSDGKTLLFRQQSEGGDWDIGMVSVDGDGEPEIFLGTSFSEHSGVLSPDDRWLAYVSNESGRDEVYIRSFPEAESKLQVSMEGGTEPMWSRDGGELFYRNGYRMMTVSVSTEPELVLGKPVLLFERPYAVEDSAPNPNYDVTGDGRFVMVSIPSAGATRLHVVLNWVEELKRLAPGN
jgi:serine/threonine-protein kinase